MALSRPRKGKESLMIILTRWKTHGRKGKFIRLALKGSCKIRQAVTAKSLEFQTMAADPTHCANFDENVEQALIGTSHNRCVYDRDVVIVCVRPSVFSARG